MDCESVNVTCIRRLTSLLVLLAGISAFAAEIPQNVRTEIAALLVRLENSGCEFNRNGTWYDAPRAKAHLERKLQAADGSVQSTEQFIELVATKSSLSGRPYLVRCGGGMPIPSQEWLADQLTEIRASAPDTLQNGDSRDDAMP